MSWVWILKLLSNRSSNNLNFSDFLSKVGNVVVRDLDSFEFSLKLLLKVADLLLLAKFWMPNKSWSVSIVSEMFSLRNCGWPVKRVFFVFLKKSQGNNREPTLELLSPGLFWVWVILNAIVIEWTIPSWFWFSAFVFADVPGTVLESVRVCGFTKISSNLDGAHKMRDSVLLKYWNNFLVTLPSVFSKTCLMYSSVIPGTDVFCDWLPVGCFSCLSVETTARFCRFLNVPSLVKKETCSTVVGTELFVFLNRFGKITEICNFKKNNYSQSVQSTDSQRWKKFPKNTVSVSPIYTFSLVGKIIVYTPSQRKIKEKSFNRIDY